jgi:hypothetical protein
MQDGEPLRERVTGEAADFLKDKRTSDGGVWGATDENGFVITRDTKS